MFSHPCCYSWQWFFLSFYLIQLRTHWSDIKNLRISKICLKQASVQFSSVPQLYPTLCDPMNHSMPDLPVHHQLPGSTQTHVHRVGDTIYLILCGPFLLLPSIFPSIRVFSNESALHIRWPKYWSFSFNISPSNEHPGLISFKMDWLDLLADQGILKSLLQHHSSKASIFRRSETTNLLSVSVDVPVMGLSHKYNPI